MGIFLGGCTGGPHVSTIVIVSQAQSCSSTPLPKTSPEPGYELSRGGGTLARRLRQCGAGACRRGLRHPHIALGPLQLTRECRAKSASVCYRLAIGLLGFSSHRIVTSGGMRRRRRKRCAMRIVAQGQPFDSCCATCDASEPKAVKLPMAVSCGASVCETRDSEIVSSGARLGPNIDVAHLLGECGPQT